MGILRLIFALTVVFAHSPWNDGLAFVGARNAVQLFYMTSGFLISYVITERAGYQGVINFYLSRWLRLYPLYLVVAGLTLFVFILFNTSFFELYHNLPLAAVISLLISNALLFGQDWIMFTAVIDGQLVFSQNFQISERPVWQGLLVPQAWSLGVELCFYLIAPFILTRKPVFLTLFFLSLLLRLVLLKAGVGHTDPWTYRFFPTELALFITGAISHQFLMPLYVRTLKNKIGSISWYTTIIFIIISLTYFLLPVPGFLKAPFLFFLYFCLLPLVFIFQRDKKYDSWLGELSYPIYISHMLVIYVFDLVFGFLNITSNLWISGLNVLGSFVFAIFLNAVIGSRVENFRHSFGGTSLHTVRDFKGEK